MAKINDINLLKDRVFVHNLDAGDKLTRGGLIIPDDDMKDRGVRDRWAQVFKVGPDVDDIVPGDWILLKHGRWTNGIVLDLPDGEVKVWRIDYPDAVIVVADEDPRQRTQTTRTK